MIAGQADLASAAEKPLPGWCSLSGEYRIEKYENWFENELTATFSGAGECSGGAGGPAKVDASLSLSGEDEWSSLIEPTWGCFNNRLRGTLAHGLDTTRVTLERNGRERLAGVSGVWTIEDSQGNTEPVYLDLDEESLYRSGTGSFDLSTWGLRQEVNGSVPIPCTAVGNQAIVPQGTVIFDVAVGVTVPPPGQTLNGSVYGLTGGQTVGVDVAANGRVTVHECGSEAATHDSAYESSSDPPPAPVAGDPPPPESSPPPAATDPSADPVEDRAAPGSPRACKDRAYNLFRGRPRWTTALHWRFNHGTRPSELGREGSEDEVRTGMRAIENAHNSCRMADNVSARQTFDGTTSKRADIGVRGGLTVCRSADSRFVADFGDLGRHENGLPTVGAHCGDHRTYGDIRLNKRDYPWFAGPVPQNCSSAFSTRAVMSHEAGHAFGLDHVGEKRHGNLTMSTEAPACRLSPYTLGRGDVLGLRRLYGP